MTTFRWGILGAARIARALIPAIRAAGGEVVALGVRDPTSERARAFAQNWNVPLVGGYEQVVEADLDAIYNPLPNDLHLPWTLATLQAGKHALTEKPFTLNAAEAAQLQTAAAKSGRVLLEAFAYRFGPHIVRLRELVGGGELGEVRLIRTCFGFDLSDPSDFRWDATKGGGALYDVGTYGVNITRLLLGEPLAVTAQSRLTSGGVDVGLSSTLAYADALASLDCGFDWAIPDTQQFTLVGTQGSVSVDRPFDSLPSGNTVLHIQKGQATSSETFAPYNAYAAMVAHFQRVARGEEAPLYPPSDAVAQAKVLDALFQSARTGERVEAVAPLLIAQSP